MAKATIYDVAKLASVSLATVSRVINGIEKVSEDTKQRVLDAVKELNYRPSSIAVELASKRNTHVAIIVPELKYTYVSRVVAGLMAKAKELGYECSIYTTTNTQVDIAQTCFKVLSLAPKGIIIFNDTLKEETIKDLINSKIPLVTLGVELDNISSVTWHYKAQVRDLVSDALNRNKEVYYIKLAGAGEVEERTIRGIKQAYENKGRKFDNFINIKDSYKVAYATMLEQIPKLNNPFIVAQRDSIALAAMNAALDLGYKVPEQIEVMACFGTKYSELSRPKLSALNINMDGLGKAGMEVMAELIDNGEQVITKKLSFDYEKRGTTL